MQLRLFFANLRVVDSFNSVNLWYRSIFGFLNTVFRARIYWLAEISVADAQKTKLCPRCIRTKRLCFACINLCSLNQRRWREVIKNFQRIARNVFRSAFPNRMFFQSLPVFLWINQLNFVLDEREFNVSLNIFVFSEIETSFLLTILNCSFCNVFASFIYQVSFTVTC